MATVTYPNPPFLKGDTFIDSNGEIRICLSSVTEGDAWDGWAKYTAIDNTLDSESVHNSLSANMGYVLNQKKEQVLSEGTGITIDRITDPDNPVISSNVAGGGQVDSVTGGTNITMTGSNVDPQVNLDDVISVDGINVDTGDDRTLNFFNGNGSTLRTRLQNLSTTGQTELYTSHSPFNLKVVSYNYTFDSSGNFSGKANDSDTVDGIHASQFLRSDTNDSTTHVLTTDESFVTKDSGAMGYISHPGGAYFAYASGSLTGAIKIRLPAAVHGAADMIKFTVEIGNYADNTSCFIDFSGYLYQTTGNAAWTNCTVITRANSFGRVFTVRMGGDGTSNCIWIGELTSSWNYPQISVTNFFAGYSSVIANYATGWNISVVTAFDTVYSTYSGNSQLLPVAYDSKLLNGYSQSDANSNNTIVRRTSGGYIKARYFHTTADDTTGTPSHVYVETSSDGFIRPQTLATFKNTFGKANDSDLFDGLNSNQFLRAITVTGTHNVKNQVTVAKYTSTAGNNYRRLGLTVLFNGRNITGSAHIFLESYTDAWSAIHVVSDIAGSLSQFVALRLSGTAGTGLVAEVVVNYTGSNGNLYVDIINDYHNMTTFTQPMNSDATAVTHYATRPAPMDTSGNVALTGTISAATSSIIGNVVFMQGSGGTNSAIGSGANLHIDSPTDGGMYLNYYNGNGFIYFCKATLTKAMMDGTGNIIAYYSDERLKNIEKPITYALDSINSWRAVHYTANDIAVDYGYDKDKKEIGLITQDIEKDFPEVVETAPISIDNETDYKTLKYERIVTILVAGMQEQTEIIAKIEARIEALEKDK